MLISCCLPVGCGGSDERPSGEFHGVITLNGKPLEGGSVHFTSPKTGETVSANLASEGQYSIKLPALDVGEVYEVAVASEAIVSGEVHAHEPLPTSSSSVKVPAKYSNRRTSGLTATVEKSGKQQFDFELAGK